MLPALTVREASASKAWCRTDPVVSIGGYVTDIFVAGPLTAPLLVIHGTRDPIYPIEHGEALAEAVAGARLVKIEGGGHELHPAHWDRIVAAIVRHTVRESSG